MSAVSCYTAATEYALRGWPVFPVGPNKKPYTDHGFKDATTDPSRITELWTKHRNAGIGFPIPAGHFILDVDPRHGGDESLSRLATTYEPFPATVKTRTGGGGAHFWFRLPKDLKGGGFKGSIGPGLDIKAPGTGYVVLPPSPHVSGKRYEWELSCDPESQNIAEAPPWLVALILDGERRENSDGGVDPIKVLAGVLEGERDKSLFEFACWMRREWYHRPIAEAAIREAARSCRPPFPEDEALKKVEQAWRYPAGDRVCRDGGHGRQQQPGGKGENGEVLPKIQTLAEVLASMPPPGERIPTGFPTIDRALRGGIVPGRVHMIVAPPGRGKTTLVTQIARRAAKDYGFPVFGYYHDEGSWQAAVMFGQGLGFEREKLENDFANIRVAFEAAVADLRVFLAPADELLDAVLDRLRGIPNKRAVAVADSVQRLLCEKGKNLTNRVDRADAVMKTLRSIAAAGAAVLACSKANRGFYARRNPEEQIEGLAAGLDSSAIEYDSDVVISMTGRIADGITARVEKNRVGYETPSVNLEFDRKIAGFREIPDDEMAARKETRERERVDASLSAAEKKIVAFLQSQSRRCSQEEIRVKTHVGRDLVPLVLKDLERRRRANVEDGSRRAKLWTLTYPGEQQE